MSVLQRQRKLKTTPYVGPCCLLTPAEAAYLHTALHDQTGDLAAAKCAACIGSAPMWRRPLG